MSLLVNSGTSKLALRTAVQLANTYLARDHANETVIVSDAVPPYLGFADTISASTGWRKADGTQICVDPPLPAIFTMTQLQDANRIYQRVTDTGGSQAKGAGVVPVTINVANLNSGKIKCRIRSADGTIFETPADVTATATGLQTVNVPVSAGLGWRYIDLSSDGVTWQNGTTLIGMGRLIALLGQSQQVRMMYRVGPGETQTFATLGLTPNANSTVFASLQVDVSTGNTPTSVDSPATPTWLFPADSNTWFTGAGMTQLMNRQVLAQGVNVGVVGHAVGGSVISQWAPGGNYLNQFLSVLGKAGGCEVCWWHLGGTDGQGTVTQAAFQAQLTAIWNAITAANTARGNNYIKADTGPAYRNTGAENPVQVNGVRKGGRASTEAQNLGFYYEPQDYLLGDSVHETPTGAVILANGFSRKLVSVAAGKTVDGPVISSATRSGNIVTINLTMPAESPTITKDQYSDNAFTRFTVYPAGTTPTAARTGAIATTAAVVASANQITLTLDPAATISGALDLYIYLPRLGSGDGQNNVFRDNYTADGVAYGRSIVSTTNTGGPIVIPA